MSAKLSRFDIGYMWFVIACLITCMGISYYERSCWWNVFGEGSYIDAVKGMHTYQKDIYPRCQALPLLTNLRLILISLLTLLWVASLIESLHSAVFKRKYLRAGWYFASSIGAIYAYVFSGLLIEGYGYWFELP